MDVIVTLLKSKCRSVGRHSVWPKMAGRADGEVGTLYCFSLCRVIPCDALPE